MSKTDVKRERILESAIAVFSKDGYHNSKITKISELAGVAAGSIYLYFDNKEHLLEEIFVRAWTKLDDKLIALTADESINNSDKITQFVEFITELVYESKNLASMILHEHRFWSSASNKKLDELVSNCTNNFKLLIIEGIKTEEFRNSIMPSIAASFIIGGIWHQLAYWAEFFNDYTLEIIKSQAIEFVLKSLK